MDERHISELVRAIKTRGQVEPVTVMQIGDKTVLIDGHHRVVAYKLAKATSAIPVRYFEGTLRKPSWRPGGPTRRPSCRCTVETDRTTHGDLC